MISAEAISLNRCVVASSKWLAAQAGQTWNTYLLMKKNTAYPDPAASANCHHVNASQLSGKIVNSVTPNNVPAARLINAQSRACDTAATAQWPPATASAKASTTCPMMT